MIHLLFRRSPLTILLVILLIMNGIRYWPHKHPAGPSAKVPGLPPPGGPMGAPPEGGAFSEPNAAMPERMKAILQKMPAEQRKAFEDRMDKDRIFFASLRNLPEEQRRQKIADYFAENPAPPGFDPANGGPGIGGPGGPGGPEDGGAFPIPPPAERRSLDQQVANSQKMGGS